MVEGELTPSGFEAERKKEVSADNIAQHDDQVNEKTALPYVGKSLSGSKAESAWTASTDIINTPDEGVKYSIGDTDYSIGKIKETPFLAVNGFTSWGREAGRKKEVSKNKVFYTDDNVKYFIWVTDIKGNKLTTVQREFFKDSKVVDEQGRLIQYHGTASEFNAFDKAW